VKNNVNNLNDLSQKLAREQGQLAELNGKADQVVSLIHQRSLWPNWLQDLNQRLGSNNIWIVSLTPQGDTGSGGPASASGSAAAAARAPGAEEEEPPPSAAPSAGVPKTIGELRMKARGFIPRRILNAIFNRSTISPEPERIDEFL